MRPRFRLLVVALVACGLARVSAAADGLSGRWARPTSARAIVVVRAPGAAPWGLARQAGDAHDRVRAEILALAGTGARRASDPVRQEYRIVLDGFAVELSPALQEELRRHPDVRGVYPDRPVRAALDSSVPAANVPPVWSGFGYRGAGQVIAVIDSGVDYTHADLGGCFGAGCKVIGGFDFVSGDPDPRDDFGHGTHVAAIAAGGGRVPGVAPEASVLAYKVLDVFGSGTDSAVIAGIERAVDPDGDGDPSDHASVINLSISALAFGPEDPVVVAVEGAVAAGAVVVSSAGNDGPAYFTVGSTGSAPGAITVGAADDAGTLRASSSRGPSVGFDGVKPDLTAPGVEVCAARASEAGLQADCRDRRHVQLSGTSMAAPHVAGAAALLRGLRPGLTPGEVKSLLVTYSASDGRALMDAGAGRLDALAAANGHTTLDPPILSFGQADLGVDTWTAVRRVRVHNLGATFRSYRVASSGLPEGANVSCGGGSFGLAAGAATEIACTLTVDTRAVPGHPDPPYAYEGVVTLDTTGGSLRLPFAFLKTTGIRVTGGEGDELAVTVHDRGATASLRTSPPGVPAVFRVPPGTYDVIATLRRPCQDDADCADGLGICFFATYCTLGSRVVVREGVEVSGLSDVMLDPAEAVHTLRFEPVDEHGIPLPVSYVRKGVVVHRASGLGTDVPLNPTADVFRSGPASDAYDVDFAMLVTPEGGEGDSYFVTDGFSGGVSESRVVGNRAADLTPIDVRYQIGPGEDGTDVQEAVLFVQPGLEILEPHARGTSWRLWISTVPRRPAPAFYRVYGTVFDVTAPVLRQSAALQGDLAAGTAAAFLRDEQTEPVYRTTVGDFPINLGPPRWFGKLVVGARGGVSVLPAVGGTFGAFLMQGGDVPPGFAVAWLDSGISNAIVDLPQSPFLTRDQVPVLNEALVGDGEFARVPFRFVVRAPLYAVGGLAGLAEVHASFDTSRADPQPPAIRTLSIESEGRLTDTILVGSAARLMVEAEDASPITVIVRTPGGNLGATETRPGRWELVLDDPCGGAAGGLPLAVDVSDAAGNVVSQRWQPAVACMPATCGDEKPDAGEACDDGNRRSGDGCNATCTSAERCGNGVRDPGEGCDDGNNASADGCSATCVVEHGCAVPSSVCFGRLQCLAFVPNGFPYLCADVSQRVLDRVARVANRAGLESAHTLSATRRCRLGRARRHLRAIDARLNRVARLVRRLALPPACRDGILGNVAVAHRHVATVGADLPGCGVVSCPGAGRGPR